MLLNLTPHAIVLRTGEGDVTLPASGHLARVSVSSTCTGVTVMGLPVMVNQKGVVTGLSRNQDGTIVPCVVSGMVLDALPAGTVGVYAPDTGSTAVRNEKGHIVAVTQLLTK